MAKAVSQETANSSYSPSLLPQTAIEHHEKTLLGPMSEWQNQKRIPPVLLLTGQPGIGKRSVAYYLSQWILCDTRRDTENVSRPCGTCPSCLRILSGQDVNLLEIKADSNEEESDHTTGILKIELFRKLKTSAGFGAHEGEHKLIIIPNAERMTTQAANSVLKLLEEPPKDWIFLLTASDSALLLPTLVSRCQMLRLKPFSALQLRTLLANTGVSPKRLEFSAELAQGSWRRAINYLSDEIWEQREKVSLFFQDPAGSLQVLIDWASQKPNHFDILLDLLEQKTAEVLKQIVSQMSSMREPDSTDNTVQNKPLDRNTARLFWLDRAESIAQARQEALAPVNRKLLIQNLLLPWMGAHLQPNLRESMLVNTRINSREVTS